MDPDPPLLRLGREAAAVAAAANHVLVSFHDLSALPVAVQVVQMQSIWTACPETPSR